MRLPRLIVAALLAASVTAGCSADATQEAAEWARGQDHVSSADLVPYDDASEGSYLRVTVEHGLTDKQVRAVAHGLKAHFDDASDAPSIDLDVDGFVGSVFPGLVTFPDGVSDPDLDRALWLRGDGRATSYGDEYHSTVSSHPLVIAPAADVAQLAIDYDAAVTHDHDVRRSESVESADGTTGVQWASSQGLGFGLDTDVVGAFARLQKEYPATTGWLTSDGGPYRAFVDLDPEDVPLADVLIGALVDPSSFSDLELGWGPARAPADRFETVFGSPRAQNRLTDLREIPGVAEVGEDGIVVRDRAAFAGVREYADRTGQDLRISLEREPVLYGFPADPVFTSTSTDTDEIVAAYDAVADLPGIARLELADRSSFGNLTVDDEATTDELHTAFEALTTLPKPYARTSVFAAVPDSYGHDTQVALGDAAADGFTPAQGATEKYPVLVQHVADAWDAARAA